MRKGHYSNHRHDAQHQRGMSKWKAGGYGLDKKEPVSMDIPEVCAFDTYGILHNPLRCKGILIVVHDVRFGIIPVCMKHRVLVVKEVRMARNKAKIVDLKRELYHEFLSMQGEDFTQDDLNLMMPLVQDSEIQELLDIGFVKSKERDAKKKE